MRAVLTKLCRWYRRSDSVVRSSVDTSQAWGVRHHCDIDRIWMIAMNQEHCAAIGTQAFDHAAIAIRKVVIVCKPKCMILRVLQDLASLAARKFCQQHPELGSPVTNARR